MNELVTIKGKEAFTDSLRIAEGTKKQAPLRTEDDRQTYKQLGEIAERLLERRTQ